jgi:hypothetical protein
MGKRSSGEHERRANDAYMTWDLRAVAPLLPHLPLSCIFIEPCAGEGHLVQHLVEAGHQCAGAFDIDATPDGTMYADASQRDFTNHFYPFDLIITNPPWTRELLHPIIANLWWQRPTWLLFDADWIHTRQARPYLPMLRKVVAVGRVKWIEDSPHSGKDNCAWHLFAPAGATEFIGRV